MSAQKKSSSFIALPSAAVGTVPVGPSSLASSKRQDSYLAALKGEKAPGVTNAILSSLTAMGMGASLTSSSSDDIAPRDSSIMFSEDVEVKEFERDDVSDDSSILSEEKSEGPRIIEEIGRKPRARHGEGERGRERDSRSKPKSDAELAIEQFNKLAAALATKSNDIRYFGDVAWDKPERDRSAKDTVVRVGDFHQKIYEGVRSSALPGLVIDPSRDSMFD